MENAIHVAEKPFLNETSPVYVSQSITETKSRNTTKWVDTYVKKKRRYRPPRGKGLERHVGGSSRAPSVRAMLEDERAAEAALAFLLDATVGCMVTNPPLEEEWG